MATPSEAASLSERLADEMRERWRQGDRPRAEEYLDRHPELWESPEDAADLIYEEVCLRHERGDMGAADDALRRFPRWHAQLEVLFNFHKLFLPARAAPGFPAAGETVGEFVLVREIGRGARGRVFLAHQPSLANRLVVLKLTPCDGEEHVSLARLQHSNIVPVHSVQEERGRNLRWLCMPYLGGTTLDRLLYALGAELPESRTGARLLQVLDTQQPPEAQGIPARGAVRAYLAGASYGDAVCALGARLADALQYAHERGLVHLDVKPSNVLIAPDGQPMLLDFHLARPPVPAGEPPEAWVGGTLSYMSPEQRRAMDAVRAGRQTPVNVDGRSDVYSLGLVLYQALGGEAPLPADAPRLDRLNRTVSRGLADVIHKCLAPNPAGRYADATGLAADLRRHLADLPLRGVPNRSWRERWRKWRRRRPAVLRLLSMGAAVLLSTAAVLLVIFLNFGEARARVRQQLADGRTHAARGAHVEAVTSLEGALAAANRLPLGNDLSGRIHVELLRVRSDGARALLNQAIKQRSAGNPEDAEEALAQAKALGEGLSIATEVDAERTATARAAAAARLRTFVDRMRFLYGTTPAPSPALEKLEQDCRRWWERRDQLGDPRADSRLGEDLLDLAILWTDLRGRVLKRDPGELAAEALDVLTAVEREFGPSAVLEREKLRHLTALGRATPASGTAPSARTAWEQYALGRSHLQAGELDAAASALREAVRLRPDGLWPNFYDGVCAFRLGRYEDAARAFTACVALRPQSAECHYNRALAFAKGKHPGRALADYDRALELAPTWGAAALNRGILHLQAKRFGPAADDFQRALRDGADPAQVHYHLALLRHAENDVDGARRHLDRALQLDPRHHAAADFRARLRR